MFASWDWLSCWWRHHRDDFRLSLHLILAYEGERLVGIAPCHARDVVHKPGLRARRLELTGNLWRTPSAVMSERTGFIVDRDHPGVWDVLSAAVFDRRDWGDFVLSLSRSDGETFGSLRRMGSAARLFVREEDPMSAYHIDLSGGFDAWLGRLGQGVRRQLFNKRSKLETAGGLRWETAAPSDANSFYEDLDRLHEARWGWSATGGRLGRVYREFGEALHAPDALHLRRLRVGSRTIAVSRAYRVADRLYDVQSAIDPDFDRSISPGYLLAGFMVEEACALGLHTVDLLGGRGREVDYKARLGGEETRLACLQIVRSPMLQAMYRVYVAGRSLLTRAGSG